VIHVILEDQASNKLKSTQLIGNEKFLIRNGTSFALLSRLSEVDYDTFCQADMSALIGELEHIQRDELSPEAIMHIDEIIELARSCQLLKGSTLTFTPFD
jgi:hypothetical protein